MSENERLHVHADQNLDLTLLANFVHQVVNPLNGVAGTLDNLVENSIEGEKRRLQRLQVARAQLEQCITLMRNLAFLAQGSGGVADKDRRKITLPQVIIESAMFYQEDGKRKNIEISLDDRNTQNTVTGHIELIRQVLMNIFDNFIKYGRKGSSVHVQQWIQRDTGFGMIRIRGESAHPIEPADIPNLKKLGYRGSNARKLIASGTGLGLYICDKIIADHGGSMFITPSSGGRITFLIRLPNGEGPDGSDDQARHHRDHRR